MCVSECEMCKCVSILFILTLALLKLLTTFAHTLLFGRTRRLLRWLRCWLCHWDCLQRWNRQFELMRFAYVLELCLCLGSCLCLYVVCVFMLLCPGTVCSSVCMVTRKLTSVAGLCACMSVCVYVWICICVYIRVCACTLCALMLLCAYTVCSSVCMVTRELTNAAGLEAPLTKKNISKITKQGVNTRI